MAIVGVKEIIGVNGVAGVKSVNSVCSGLSVFVSFFKDRFETTKQPNFFNFFFSRKRRNRTEIGRVLVCFVYKREKDFSFREHPTVIPT